MAGPGWPGDLTSHLPARLSARMTFSLANSFFSLTIPLANSFFGNSGSMNWAWIEEMHLRRFGHIFATVARIDKLLGYSERSHRTTSEYTIYLIKLARPKKSYELFEIFGKKILKTFFDFSKLFQNFQNFREKIETFFQLFSQLFFQKHFEKSSEFFLVAPNLSSK